MARVDLASSGCTSMALAPMATLMDGMVSETGAEPVLTSSARKMYSRPTVRAAGRLDQSSSRAPGREGTMAYSPMRRMPERRVRRKVAASPARTRLSGTGTTTVCHSSSVN